MRTKCACRRRHAAQLIVARLLSVLSSRYGALGSSFSPPLPFAFVLPSRVVLCSHIFIFFFLPIIVSVACPTGPHPPLRLARRPNRGHIGFCPDLLCFALLSVRQVKEFYQFWEGHQEAWDGPALLVWSDGKHVGACLDRNGLRPARYMTLKDGTVLMMSETGVVPVDEAEVWFGVLSRPLLAPVSSYVAFFGAYELEACVRAIFFL